MDIFIKRKSLIKIGNRKAKAKAKAKAKETEIIS